MPYWRLSSFYFSYFALLGAIIPFWTLYLSDLGFDPLEIGALAAIMMGTKIVSPYLLGWLADKSRRPMRVIRWSALLSFVFFLGIFLSSDFYYVAIIIASFTFFWNAVIGQFESVTLSQLGEHYSQYGKVRAWGSIGFILAVLVLGWLFNTISISYLPLFMAMMLFSIWGCSLLVKDKSNDDALRDAIGDMAEQGGESTNGLFDILKRPAVIAFFSACFLLQLSHGPYYTFYSLYLTDFGYSKLVIGLLWGAGVVAELLLFLVMSRILRRLSVRVILLISMFFCLIRWPLIGLFPDYLAVLLVSQMMHAFTFASFHAVAVQWVRQAFGSDHQGQGQALYSAVGFGAGGAAGALISGIIWSYNPLLVWLLAGIAGGLGFIIIWRFIAEAPIAQL
jgi:PPP family 3-phenylpropionic acid transporter